MSDLKLQLSAAKAQHDNLKVELETARSSAEAARKREAQLQHEVEELRFLMDEAHAKADEAKHGVSMMHIMPGHVMSISRQQKCATNPGQAVLAKPCEHS